MSDALSGFLPVLMYVGILLGFVVTNLILAHVIGPRKKTTVKQMPYESGMDPVGDARQPLDVKFYLVAILFLVFDVELLFLYPWSVSAYANNAPVAETVAATVPATPPASGPIAGEAAGAVKDATAQAAAALAEPGLPIELSGAVFGVMLVFMATLAIAYVYAWRKGVFQWR